MNVTDYYSGFTRPDYAARLNPIERPTNFLERVSLHYFRPKPFEQKGTVYEMMGIRPFQRALLKVMVIRKRSAEKHGSNYFIGQRKSVDDLVRFERLTRFNEAVHVLGVLPGINATIDSLAKKQYATAAFGVAIVVPQIYLCMLQRYNRARIYATIDEKLTRRTVPARDFRARTSL